MAIWTGAWPWYGDSDEAMIERPDEALREMAELLRDTRPGMLVSGVTVAAVTVGVAVEETVLPVNLHAGAGAFLGLVLLGILAVSIVRTAVLMRAAGRPLMDELGELRRRTGAPVDPTVPWTPIRKLPLASPAPGWERARAVLAAAHFRNERMQMALTWATVTIISFAAWTFVQLLLAGRI
jgi:hypothetical protein